MITPKFLNKVIEELENSIALLNDDMTKKIAKKMASSFSSNMPKNQKELSKMLNDKNVYDDIQEAISKRKKSIDAEVKKAYLKSACEISNHNTEVAETLIKKEKLDIELPRYARNTVKASEMNLTDKEVLRVEKAYKKAQNVVNNLTGTMPSDGQNAYIDACNKAFLKVQQGQNLDNALTSAIDEMAQLGITHVNYDSGRRERIEVAVARSVRTGINQMNADLVLQRCATMGVSYVQVSQHLGARVTKKEDYTNHSLWQGKVYSIDWNKSVFKEKGLAPEEIDEPRFNWLNKIKEAFTPKKPSYPDFVDKCGYGLLLGICGVNCRHTFRLFIPEVNSEYGPLNDTENELQYEAEQKARAMERAIRETKREINALEYSGLHNEFTDNKISQLKTKLSHQKNLYNSHIKVYDINNEYWRIKTVDESVKRLLDNPVVHPIGKLSNIDIIEKEFGKLKSDIVIVTDERIEHMLKGKHPQDFMYYEKYKGICISNPDLILKDHKNKNSILCFYKDKTETESVNICIKLALYNENKLNSVISSFRMNDENMKTLISKTKILYKNNK